MLKEKVIFDKNSKKLLFCPSTQERLLNYKSSARKSRKDTVCVYHTMSSISRMAFVNLILIEKISTLSYEQEKNFIISESRIQKELRTLTQTLSLILTKANATD